MFKSILSTILKSNRFDVNYFTPSDEHPMLNAYLFNRYRLILECNEQHKRNDQTKSKYLVISRKGRFLCGIEIYGCDSFVMNKTIHCSNLATAEGDHSEEMIDALIYLGKRLTRFSCVKHKLGILFHKSEDSELSETLRLIASRNGWNFTESSSKSLLTRKRNPQFTFLTA